MQLFSRFLNNLTKLSDISILLKQEHAQLILVESNLKF